MRHRYRMTILRIGGEMIGDVTWSIGWDRIRQVVVNGGGTHLGASVWNASGTASVDHYQQPESLSGYAFERCPEAGHVLEQAVDLSGSLPDLGIDLQPHHLRG